MAVEARHLNLFPPQFFANRERMNPIEPTGEIYNTQMGYGGGVPLSEATTAAETALLPMYSSVNNMVTDSFVPHVMKPAIQSVDSSVTFNGKRNDLFLPQLASRKRWREDSVVNAQFSQASYVQNQKSCNPFYFLGQDMSLHFQQQQLDIDRVIFHHMERVKMEIEEKKKRQGRSIMEAIEQGVMKRLRAKEEEIQKIGKLNLALEERIKSIYVENQIWRDLAHTNEATANALRSNLEQVLAEAADHARDGPCPDDAAEALAEDAQSFCGSSGGDDDNGEEVEERCMLAVEAQYNSGSHSNKRMRGCRSSRMCRHCGKEESCVLLLPCRHLCLCTVCGSTLHTCPICKSVKNASVHVNMSS